MTAIRLSGLTALFLVLGSALAAAQQQQPQTGVAQGLASNRDQPVKIESNSLEVRDKSRMATFTGNVKMTQGDSVVQCKVLIVYYEEGGAAPAANAKPAPAPAANAKSGPAIASPGGGKQQIKRMECKGDALITQKDQVASGENGFYDAKANTLTLIGKVVVTQGQNVMRGEKMVVNLTTGVTKVESGKEPVSGIMFPNAEKDAKPAPQAAPPAAAQRKPSGPMRLNRSIDRQRAG